MNAHWEAMAMHRAALGIVDRPTVLTESAPPDEASPLVNCTDCRSYRGRACITGRAAGLVESPFDLGAMAKVPQRCPAFIQRPDAKAHP